MKERENDELVTAPGSDGADAPLADLEPQQYEPLYHEDDVPLADVRENALRVLVYVGAVVIVLLVVLGAVVEIPRELQLGCVVEGGVVGGSEPEYLYRFFDPVYLEERYVEVGDDVAAGAPLVRISSPGIVELIARYDEAVERQRIFDDAERAVFESQIAALALEEAQADEVLADVRSRLGRTANIFREEQRRRQSVADRARDEYGRQRTLFDKQLGAASLLQAAETARVEAETSLESLSQEHEMEVTALQATANRTQLEKAVLQQRREEKRNALRNREATLQSELENTRAALYRTYGDLTIERGSLVLRAPYAGRVSVLSNRGRQVEAETVVVGVLAEAAHLRVHTAVPAGSIGLVRAGAPVVVKIDTYPHYEWGVIEGRITSLSLSPDDQGHYPVEVTLDEGNRLTPLLRIGMTGELSVVVEKKSMLAYLFNGLQRGYHEVVKG